MIIGLGRSSGKKMTAYSSVLAWRIPCTEKSGRVYGVTKSQTQLSDLAAAAAECLRASLVAQMIKNLPAMQGTLV